MLLWWFACSALDPHPPEIRVAGPKGPIRLAARFQIEARDEVPGLSRVVLTVPDQTSEVLLPERAPIRGEVEASFPWTHGVQALRDGEYQLVFTAVDASWRANSAAQSLSIVVDRTPPTLEGPLGAMEGLPGEVLEVRVSADEPLSGGAEIDGPVMELASETTLIGRFEVHEEERIVRIRATDLAGNHATTEFSIRPTTAGE